MMSTDPIAEELEPLDQSAVARCLHYAPYLEDPAHGVGVSFQAILVSASVVGIERILDGSKPRTAIQRVADGGRIDAGHDQLRAETGESLGNLGSDVVDSFYPTHVVLHFQSGMNRFLEQVSEVFGRRQFRGGGGVCLLDEFIRVPFMR